MHNAHPTVINVANGSSKDANTLCALQKKVCHKSDLVPPLPLIQLHIAVPASRAEAQPSTLTFYTRDSQYIAHALCLVASSMAVVKDMHEVPSRPGQSSCDTPWKGSDVDRVAEQARHLAFRARREPVAADDVQRNKRREGLDQVLHSPVSHLQPHQKKLASFGVLKCRSSAQE